MIQVRTMSFLLKHNNQWMKTSVIYFCLHEIHLWSWHSQQRRQFCTSCAVPHPPPCSSWTGCGSEPLSRQVMFLYFEATINLNLGHVGLGLLAGGGRASSELQFDHLGIPRNLHMINVLLQLHIIDFPRCWKLDLWETSPNFVYLRRPFGGGGETCFWLLHIFQHLHTIGTPSWNVFDWLYTIRIEILCVMCNQMLFRNQISVVNHFVNRSQDWMQRSLSDC